MKKIVVFICLIGLLVISTAEVHLSDISTHWAKSYVASLVAKEAIAGYPDGTFRPEGSIKIGEFTKILVVALGHKGIANSQTGHWATHYMDKGVALKLITNSELSGDLKDWNQNITRGQMARMISRAMIESFDDLELYSKQLSDIGSLPSDQRQAVLLMYRAGIITGYPDGTFKASNTATRAEASTLLMRFLDKDLRQVPELKTAIWSDAAFEAFINKNPEAVKYASTRFFYIKDKQLVFKKGKGGLAADTVAPETNFPGLNALVYRGAKQLIWDAYQNGDYVSIGYVVAYNMYNIGFNYYENQLMGEAMVHDGNFMLLLEVKPINPSDWPEMDGLTKKVKMYWLLLRFYGDEDDALYTEKEQAAMNYMLPKYVAVFKAFVKTIYNTDSDEIYNYMFGQFQRGLEPADLKVIDGIEIKTLKDEGAVYRCYTSY